MDRFTQLPPFTNDNDNGPHQIPVQWIPDLPALSDQVYILAWANLLYCFTHDENPVFMLNGEPLKADLSSRIFHPAILDAEPDVSRPKSYTEVLIEDGGDMQTLSTSHDRLHPGSFCILSFTLNRVTRNGALHSFSSIDHSFLQQIGKQLKQMVLKQAHLSGLLIELPTIDTPEASIFNTAPSTLPGPQLLHELALGGFKESSKEAIDFLSAGGTNRSLSYKSLDHLSSKLASQIAKSLAPFQEELPQNVVIPVFLPQSLELYISCLGILKAGAAFCPLNIDTPLERMKFVLHDVSARILVTNASLASKVPNEEQLVVIIVDDLESEDVLETTSPVRECHSSHLAYVMYTSGSSGLPKGVAISHLAATQSLLAHDELIPQFHRFLQFASPTFDVSVFEWFFPLMRGATVVGCDRETMLRDISYVMRRMNVDGAELTPTVAGELLRNRAAAPSLRVLLTIGEMLTRRVVNEFGASATVEGILHGMYGPTEAAIHCTAAPNYAANSRVNLIGRPLKTVSAYIVSLQPEHNLPGQELHILPVGQIGELVIGGPQLADGYFNRPEENAKAFLETSTHSRLYRTGDKARMLPNGEIECFGRVSSGQFKLRGQRIEFGEIEHAICKAPNVRSAVAIVANGSLVAFLLLNDRKITDDELRQVCRRWLPRFMVPGEFILMDSFPQLPSGKIDRKLMEAEYLQQRQEATQSNQQTFRDAVEETIFSCTTGVLHESIRSTDSLAAAGLDSLRAILFASYLRDAGFNIEVGSLLEADSVDAIWHLVKAKKRKDVEHSAQLHVDLQQIWQPVESAGHARLSAIGLGSEVERLEPCNHIQQAMIVETIRNAKAYCNWIELEFDSPIDFNTVRQAFIQIARQNDLLRSGFVEIGLKNYSYSRFTWKELQDRVFRQCEYFNYDLNMTDEHGILYPLRVQYQQRKDKLHILVHIHHALYDGWSWDLVLSDLQTALEGHNIAPRPPYRAVTEFLIESQFLGSASESSLFWQDQLSGMSPVTWPNFNSSVDIPAGRGEVTRVLSVPQSEIIEVSQHLRISRQAIFQAAFCHLLSSYMGVSDVVFGTVFSGRTFPVQGIESIIGPCLRVLPTRMNLDKVQTVADLFLAIHNLNRKSLEHGTLPLQEIKKVSEIDLSLSLFDSVIVWQETIFSNQRQNTLFREIAAADFLEFALLLELEPKDRGIQAKATYQSSVLPSTQVEHFLEQLDNVVSVLIHTTDLPINEIPRSLPSSVLSIENADCESPTDLASLAGKVETIASAEPDQIAIEFVRSQNPESGSMIIESITYNELNLRANRLAHYLLHLGVRQHDLIGILLDKSIDLYVSVLAILKIGAGYVPLLPNTPTQRLHTLLVESNARICITDSHSEQEHDLSALKSLQSIDLRNCPLEEYPDHNLSPVLDGSSIAYIIFTSGSTGTPKGVQVTHYNMQSNLAVLIDLYPTPRGSKILQFCSQAFDLSVFDILFAWHTGMTLCSATNDILFRDIQHVIRELKITHLNLTPTVASLISPEEVPSVQFIVTAGEGLTSKVHHDWADKGLYQGYGPCETTNICTVNPNVGASTPLRNIGPPLKNVSAFVITEDTGFYPVLRGAIGELCFGGPQVSRGYLNMPSLTASKFLDHPKYGRLYRSGDYGRLLPDGSILFTGRRDDQVKLRGQRIELGEISNVLLQQSGTVQDCASLIIESGPQKQQQLVTFWVPSAFLNTTETQMLKPAVRKLFEKLSSKLPAYMVPSLLVPIPTLPLTHNGKIDKRKLQQRLQEIGLDEKYLLSPELMDGDNDEDFSELERTVATVLSSVTNAQLQDIRRYTSFYNVGLDSISAISFSRKLLDSGLGQLDVSIILRHSSVARLSVAILENLRNQAEVEPIPLGLETVFDSDFVVQVQEDYNNLGKSVKAIYPCTPLQEAMLSAEVSTGISAYFNHVLFEIKGNIDNHRETWSRMVERHSIFRTYFKATNNSRFAYAQILLDSVTLPWYSIETSVGELKAEVEKAKRHFEGKFQLSGMLPYSLTDFRDKTSNKSFLLLSIHHALYDGEAMVQLLREFQLSLLGSPLPELVPFDRFIGYMLRMDINKVDAYWDDYLSEMSQSLLCGLKNNSETMDDNSSHQSYVELDIPYALFKDKCKEVSVTPLNVFHAAWARLLSLYTDSPDVCFGTVLNCRTIPLEGADRIVGPCFNTLPVRIALPPTATNEDIMKAAQKSNSDTMRYQLSSLRRIQSRALSDGTSLFDTMILLQTRSQQLDSNIWELVSEEGSMDFPLICEIIPDDKDDKINICLHSQNSSVSPKDTELIIQQFAALICHTVRYPFAQASYKRLIEGRMPLLPRKLARRPRKMEALASASVQATHPWSRHEEEIRDILCKISKVDRDTVSQGTTIFQLGLDSINAVQISSALRDLGYDISAGSILEAATVSEIATLLSSPSEDTVKENYDFASFESQHLRSTCEQLQIAEDTVECIRPCTPVQNGMLAMFSNSNDGIYFNKMTLTSSKSLDKASLKEAWLKVMAKHEMLRTGFVQLKDQQHPFAMVTYRDQVVKLPWYEVTDLVSETIHSQTVQEVLKTLHQPPWFLAVDHSESVTSIQFSALHAIYDAQSLHLILADVAAAHRGESIGNAVSINPAIGRILVESVLKSDESQKFWTEIGTEIQPTKFPDLHPLRTEKKVLLVNSKLCSNSLKILENGCQKLGTTLQAAAQAAWARLLSAYTGETNVCFGVVSSGRNLSAAAQEAVFPCLVTMPSPCQTVGTNRELLHGILKRNSSLVKYQFTPLSKIQRWLKSDEGLFDTLFVYQKMASQKEDSEFWQIEDEEAKIDYPVSIELIPHAAELEFRLTHRSDVVPDEHAMIILEQLDSLLANTVFSPDSTANDYSSLGNDLLSVTPAKEDKIPCTVSLLHEFVEEKAATIPSKIALEFVYKVTEEDIQKKTWTYREFNDEGKRIARLLQRKGAVPGSLVGICFDKCPEASLGILGVLKAGCAYLAIDPNAPTARKQFILEDSATTLMLCTSSGKAALEGLSGVELIVLDEPSLLDGISSEEPILARPVRPNDTCYCLYTSGTTGTPKGCEITHDNAVQAMLAFQRLFAGHWDEESRWLQFASFHFDVSVLEQYWSWSVGICVTSCPRDLLFEDLPGTIRRLQITHIDLTPSLARLVFPDEVPSLCRGVFITGGEALKQEVLDAWGRYEVIYNGYGPTEVTIGCTMLPRVPANGKPSNIGPQFDNVGSYVLAPGTSTPVLRGGIGELCVSGALVGRGYLNRAELTKERFQYLSEYGERIYRTGDLVRILHNGCFQFLGRIDDQVKLRGQRLEIGEINEVIKRATPELNEVSTLVIKHPKQSKDQLVSFVTKNSSEKKLRSAELRFSQDDLVFLTDIKNACQKTLPGYMVPTHIIPMTAFPLSPNNKIDNKVLKAIYEQLSLEDIQKLASMPVRKSDATTKEKKIIAVLAKFIGAAENDIQSGSSIFELGLDSISIIPFSRCLRDAGFSQAQPSLIMKNSTISGMASALQVSKTPLANRTSLYKNAKQNIEAFAHRHSHALVEALGISANDIENIAPCTPLQEGIIYHFLNSGKALYCSSFVFELQPHVDLVRLGQAWSQTLNEVEMLRARLSPTADGYAQVILKNCHLPFAQVTVSSDDDIENARQGSFKAWSSNLGNLSTNLWEVWLVQSPGRSVMCLNIFHALYDGNSLSLLTEQVAANYVGETPTGKQCSFLETLPAGPLCKEPLAEKFWVDHLIEARKEALPRSNSHDHSSLVAKVDISATECVDKLRKLLNVTEQAILHACWLLTLSHHYGFVPTLGIVVSGRFFDIPGVENVIGPLFNTIPSNVNFRGLKTWSDIVQRCHDYSVSTIPFQHTPLRDIMKWTRRTPSEPLFDSLFVFQRARNENELKGNSLWRELDNNAQHEYPLAFEVVRHGHSTLTATIAVQDHVMSPEMARDMLSNFEKQLRALSENPATELPQAEEILENSVLEVDGIGSAPQGGEVGTDNDSDFDWTPGACSIRDAIVELAGIGKESVGARTSIFELGLDSIDAIKLSSSLSKSGIRLTVSMIMRYRTIEKMSEQLATTNGGSQKGQLSSLSVLENTLTKFMESEMQIPKETYRILPATPLQEAMVAEMAASNYTHYYNHEVLELQPHVDIERMRNSWDAVVKAHPILRTSFIEVWDPKIPVSYAQIIHREKALDFQIVDLQGKPVGSIIEHQRLRAASNTELRPLLTMSLAVDTDKRYLILSIAHSLYDGWSINLLHEDVATCYAGGNCQRPGYDDILDNILASSGDNPSKFWRAALANFVPTPFPKGRHAGGDELVVHRAERPFAVSSDAVDEFCKRHGITMQALCVSCWALVLAGYVQKLDVVFGLVFSGRNLIDSEHVMFPTMNTVAMRAILHGGRMEMVKYIQNTLVDMSEHQHFPLRKVRTDIGARQLFDTLFIYQKKPSETQSETPVLYTSSNGSSAIEYPVCVEMENVAETVVCRVACQDNILGAKDAAGLVDRIEHVLSLIMQEPDDQTIDFADGGMSICGSPAFQDILSNGIAEERSETRPPRQTAWSTIELQIQDVLSIVSGVSKDQIEKETTIYHLGLDSISAIKVASFLKKRDIRLTVSDMLKAGTIEGMARVASHKFVEPTSEDLNSAMNQALDGIDITALAQSYGLDLEQVERIFPATAGQSYFLSMNALSPETFYPNFYYLANKDLSRDLLNTAWDRATSHLPVLRTAFMLTTDKHIPYVQAVMNSAKNPITWHTELHELMACTSEKRSISSVPLTVHACQAANGTVLMLQIHHALYDAVSLPRIMEVLGAFYDNKNISSQTKNVDLSRYVAFERIYSPVDARRSFWENYLGKNNGEKASTNDSASFGAIESYYRPGLVSNMSKIAKIEAIAKRDNISVQSILLAAYARVHARNFDQSRGNSMNESGNTTVGLYLANRSHVMEGLTELIAPTLNIVPLRIDDKQGDIALLTAAKKIQEELNEISAVERASVSPMEIAAWTGITLDTCINILRFPEIAQTDDTSGRSEGAQFAPIDFQNLSELRGSTENGAPHAEANGFSAPNKEGDWESNSKEDSLNYLKEVFKPTLDVEVAIRNDRLDFGVFGPQNRVGTALAEKIIEDFRQEMARLSTDAQAGEAVQGGQ